MAKSFMEVWTSTYIDPNRKQVRTCTLRLGKVQYPFRERDFTALKTMVDETMDDQFYNGEVIFGTAGTWRAILHLRHITPVQVLYILNGKGTVRRVEDQTKINALKAMIALEGDDHSLINEHLERLFNEHPDNSL